jgi:Fic family protein
MIGMPELIETPSRIEPCLPGHISPEILDLATSLSAAAERLPGRLHPLTAANLADLVRIMNCYYSNLIEGHNTRPRDIERALANEFDTVADRRNLQLEARAHIRVQKAIDLQHRTGKLPEPCSPDFILWLHRTFYDDAPEPMLQVKGAGRTFQMQPGAFRRLPEHDVVVGRHVPPSSAVVQTFMEHFARRYDSAHFGTGQRIVAMAAAHHRLSYIHPFPDGNGRVGRLLSHAMALQAGIGAHSLWSVSRGLARGLESASDYKRMLDYADSPRQGDLDGRGPLSEKALNDFIVWFLRICLDQIEFMSRLFALDTLTDRLKTYVERRFLKQESFRIIEAVLQRGELSRGEVRFVTGLKERSARELLSELVTVGLLGSQTPKGPVSLCLPLAAVETLFPDLFPET